MKKMTAAMLTAVCLFSMTAITVYADTDRWTSTTSKDEDGDILIDFEEVQVILPGDWAGKCQMGVSDDAVAFYHTKSRQQCTAEYGYACGGWLFTVHFSEELDFLQNANFEIIGRVPEGYYYASFPTDVQGYMNDAETLAEYTDLHADLEWITENYSITGEELPLDSYLLNSSEYIFPESNSAYLSNEDLTGMTKDEVQMAINEIYARHHRKFVLEHVQTYFNSKSWYTGTVEAADFDVSVMNTYEGANINLMVEYMKTAPATREENLSTASSGGDSVTAAATADAYGMIIESGSGYFIIRQEDGSQIQFWYELNKLADMGLAQSDLKTGAVVSLIYDTESYEAVEILIF